jgi:hypothetical protein
MMQRRWHFTKSSPSQLPRSGAETPAHKVVSNLTTGIKALVARYRQEYQDARGGLQKGSLITPDDSGRQNAIRVYIFGESGIVGVYFRLVTHGI